MPFHRAVVEPENGSMPGQGQATSDRQSRLRKNLRLESALRKD